jgi:hypothetical protein
MHSTRAVLLKIQQRPGIMCVCAAAGRKCVPETVLRREEKLVSATQKKSAQGGDVTDAHARLRRAFSNMMPAARAISAATFALARR